MPPELAALALAALLLAAQLAHVALLANREAGTAWFLSPRDTPPPALSAGVERLRRAYANHLEALLLFAVAVLVVTAAGRRSALTETCAWAYLAARVLYVPAYRFGWVPWRSLLFGIGWGASVVMLAAALA